MSVSGISSVTDFSQTNSVQTKFKQMKDDFQQLGQALQSGDLSGAQSAFASLLPLFPNSSSSANSQTQSAAASSASSSGNGTSSITSDLSALGQALQSNDLTGAQYDFLKLMQDIQSIGGGHHRHHHHKTLASSQDTTNSSATSSNTGTNSVSTDLAALGQALQSGDLKSAGNAYSQLMQDMQTIKSTRSSINISA